jgi:hypothetical protein
MSPAEVATRRQLWRWLGWFGAVNAGLLLLIGLRYLGGYGWPESTLGMLYVPLTLLGHFALLAFLPLVLLAGLAIAVWPRHVAVMAVAVLVAALLIALLVLDTNVYVERRMHLNLLVAALFEPITWFFAAIVLMVALLFESLLAGALWRWLHQRSGSRGGRALFAAIVCCTLLSQGLHVWADAVAYQPVTRLTNRLPLYYPLHAKRRLAKWGLIDQEQVRQASLRRRAAGSSDGQLNYPLAPLRCAPTSPLRPNVLWIVVDALRPDVVTREVMPALTAFGAQAQVFAEHWSGGNSSRMGAFGMFYGLPSTYFQAFYSAGRAPVLMDQFVASGYTMKAISAAGFGSPTLLDRTVVAGVADAVSTVGEDATESNLGVNRAFLPWLAARTDPKPFFALLWYVPPVAEIPLPEPLPRDTRYVADPKADAMWNGYRHGLRQTDLELAEVFSSLQAAGHADDTIVLVMGDHGYEFNEFGLGYYGHASNYGRFQLRTPLYIRWPGRAPRVWTHRTSHLELPATLLTELFGCGNAPRDYSIGRDLFTGRSWDWILAGSYHSHAIVEPGRVIVTEPGGLLQVLGPDLQPARDDRLDPARIEASLLEMRRFYR